MTPDKKEIKEVIQYKNRSITVYPNGTASVAGMRFDNVWAAKEAIDKIISQTKVFDVR